MFLNTLIERISASLAHNTNLAPLTSLMLLHGGDDEVTMSHLFDTRPRTEGATLWILAFNNLEVPFKEVTMPSYSQRAARMEKMNENLVCLRLGTRRASILEGNLQSAQAPRS